MKAEVDRMPIRVRLLPVLMTSAIMLFSLKSVSLWTGVNTFVTGVGTAIAEEPSRTHTETADEPGGHGKSDEHDFGDHKQDRETNEHHAENDGHDMPSHGKEKSRDSAKKKDQRRDESSSSFYSRSEIEVLQQLGDRRNQLEAREREIQMREQLLVAAEQRVEKRVAELKKIEANIESLLVQKEGEDEKKITSLVKVYETMKAKDAARIFDTLELEVLVPVAQRMKEQKIAAVLAKMKSDAAQRLTVELAAIEESNSSVN